MEITDSITGEIKVGKQPFFIHRPKRQVFPFASVMSWWKSAESEAAILTAAIITRDAEGVAAEVHTRMPILLPKEAEAAWLDREQTDGKLALELAQTLAVTQLAYYPVSSRVNNSKSTGMELIESFPNPA